MKKWTEQKVYIYLALFFGILFVFLIPPFQSPDEDSHFKKTYQVSNGHLYSSVKNGKAGNVFPVEMISYIDDKLTYMSDLNKKYTYSEMVLDQYLSMNYSKKKHIGYSTSGVFPFVYIAPALGIVTSKVIAHIFDFKMITTSYMLYFARIFSLLFATIITYFAIKKTPVLKKTFLVVALSPMVLFLNSGVSYDSVITSLSLLALAIILELILIPEKNFSKKEFIILTLIGIILLNVKVLYFMLYFLMFLIPKEKFKGMKSKVKIAIGMSLLIICISLIIKLPYMLQSVAAGEDFKQQQIAYIIGHPFAYIKILLRNILDQRKFQLISMVGLLGLLDTYPPIGIVAGIYLNMILVALSEGSTNIQVNNKTKIVSIIYVTLAVVGIYSAMYVTWTPAVLGTIGGKDISGVQGRYFIPLLVPALLILSNKKLPKIKVFKIINNNYAVIPSIALIVSSLMLLLRFWV